jgi:hypothetical protein
VDTDSCANVKEPGLANHVCWTQLGCSSDAQNGLPNLQVEEYDYFEEHFLVYFRPGEGQQSKMTPAHWFRFYRLERQLHSDREYKDYGFFWNLEI